jgi:hypothetical protein
MWKISTVIWLKGIILSTEKITKAESEHSEVKQHHSPHRIMLDDISAVTVVRAYL